MHKKLKILNNKLLTLKRTVILHLKKNQIKLNSLSKIKNRLKMKSNKLYKNIMMKCKKLKNKLKILKKTKINLMKRKLIKLLYLMRKNDN